MFHLDLDLHSFLKIYIYDNPGNLKTLRPYDLKNIFYNNNESFKNESSYLSKTHPKILMNVINAVLDLPQN